MQEGFVCGRVENLSKKEGREALFLEKESIEVH
jgi:hypothetical protein